MKKRSEFEEKYKVEVQLDKKGKSVVVDREKDEVEVEQEKKKIAKLAKKGIVVKSKEEKRVARRERERARKNKKKPKDKSNVLDFDDFKDTVAFGDTVDAPPTLKFKNFEKTSSTKPASEGKAALLLHKLDESGGGKVKKVKLSGVQKVRQEQERLSVVEQYRKKKAALHNS